MVLKLEFGSNARAAYLQVLEALLHVVRGELVCEEVLVPFPGDFVVEVEELLRVLSLEEVLDGSLLVHKHAAIGEVVSDVLSVQRCVVCWNEELVLKVLKMFLKCDDGGGGGGVVLCAYLVPCLPSVGSVLSTFIVVSSSSKIDFTLNRFESSFFGALNPQHTTNTSADC